MTESQTQQQILIALNSRPDGRLFRNQVGVLHTIDGRTIRAGLCVGSSDLIGWYNGRFLAIEVKSDTGRTTTEQDAFLAAVRRGGGLAGVARSVDEALQIISCAE
jgi:hypothetical protein